jgi:hypothetical protein
MSRHLGNLQRVLNKMQLRYGEQDALVLELKQEVEQQHSTHAAGTGALPATERRRKAGRITQRSDNPLQTLAPRAWRMANPGNNTPRSNTH